MFGYSPSRCSFSPGRITVASGATWLPFSAISSSFLRVSPRPQRPSRQYTITHTTLWFRSHAPSTLIRRFWPEGSFRSCYAQTARYHIFTSVALRRSRETWFHNSSYHVPFVKEFVGFRQNIAENVDMIFAWREIEMYFLDTRRGREGSGCLEYKRIRVKVPPRINTYDRPTFSVIGEERPYWFDSA